MSESFIKPNEKSFKLYDTGSAVGIISDSCQGKFKHSVAVGLSLISNCTPVFQ